MTQQNKQLNMEMNIELLGNINTIGSHYIDSTISLLDVLAKAKGMKLDKQLELVQIGGPLGTFIKGQQLNDSVSQYKEQMEMDSIMFLNNAFCPVDFARFMIYYVKREMQHNSSELDVLCNLIDEITSGNARKFTYTELLDIINTNDANDTVLEKLKVNVKYLTDHYAQDFKTHIESKKCDHSICYKLFSAQCINTCPAEINIPGYVALMYRGQDEDAYRLMRQNNPLPFVCGKICARPCEDRCRRGEIEQTVGVRALKHYASSVTLDKPFTEDLYSGNGKSVGIIGSGPAGLSAAHYLAKTGYEVHIYEKHPVVGGMLAVGIPAYRLSQESIDKEVQLIKNLGVIFHTNTEIGKEISFNNLKDIHDSILLATGCHTPNMFSDHLKNTESAIDFLREVKLNDRKEVGKEVIVIGGGDVAMDAARTATRLGAQKVSIVSLESFDQMPANDEEKEEAQLEGIELINGYGTDKIIDKDNIAHEIALKQCTSIFDLENNFKPTYNDNETMQLSTDHIILAIGQRSDVRYLNEAVALDERGRIISQNGQNTSLDGIFMAGDILAPGSAIKAIAEGKNAAKKIDSYLGGEGLFAEQEIKIPDFQLHYSVWDTKLKKEEVQLYSETNKNPFAENRSVLTETMAREEALRCMRCDRNSRR